MKTLSPRNFIVVAHHRSSIFFDRMTYLPVMPVGINNPSKPPAVIVINGHYLLRTGGDGVRKNGIGIGNDQHQSCCAAIEGFRAEIMMLGRFVRNPKVGTVNREAGDNGTGIFEDKHFLCTKGGL